MKLRTQILGLGMAGSLAAALVGAFGILQANHLRDAVNMAVDASTALTYSREADMMHDAVRGDAQRAMLGLHEKDPARISDAAKELDEHAKNFDTQLDQLQAMHLENETLAELKRVRALEQQYVASAQRIVKATASGQQPSDELKQGFQEDFEALEKQMGQLSTALEKRGESLNTAAKAAASDTRSTITVALLLAGVALICLALWLARHIAKPVRQAVHLAEQLAQGDLTADINPVGNDETRQLLDSMAGMKASLTRIVHEVKSNARSVADTSVEIASGNTHLSERTDQQTGALEKTASSMQQLGNTVQRNANNARQANELARGASTVASRGGAVVGEVVETMKGITESSRRISDITSVIDAIAFQTNILALNAAVEAARAGEAGRGFAVVAGEVRGLAHRCAEAAREIKQLIGVSVERVEQGTLLVDQAGATMGEIVGAIGRVTAIMGEISSASEQQSCGVAEVGEAITHMDQATQQNAALVQQGAAAAKGLKQQAAELVRVVSAFRTASNEAHAPA